MLGGEDGLALKQKVSVIGGWSKANLLVVWLCSGGLICDTGRD